MFATPPHHIHQAHHPHYNPLVSNIPNGHAHMPNGNAVHNGNSLPQQPPPPAQSHRPPQQVASKEPITVVGIPSVSIQTDRLIVGNSESSSTRSYTPLKVLGDGSFGTVWLCDWHGTLPPNTPLSPMQCGAGARPEWAGKRLVAVKRMKKKWEGGWDECKKLKELESLRAITFHPNVIPLYDFFLLPASKELYFVFESMEGNLYHLIKARKGRALAGGLVSSIFRQIATGLHHIHSSGYFHRDMKPENVLVTTTGLFDYQSVSPLAKPNSPPEKDVVAIIKLADFGLARETRSKPPYTEYVATRWYRAPEVLLLSRDYSNPVDMWAFGTIMAELVNLRPLFPGSGQIDQVARICEVLGDPSDEYGQDTRGRPIGGGKWSKGIKMARAVGFAFPKIQPKDIHSLFEGSVPHKLVECIADLLKYNPDLRLTSRQCLDHPYLLETLPKNNIPLPPGVQTSAPSPTIPAKSSLRNGIQPSVSLPSSSTRDHPPSHPQHSSPSPHPHPSFSDASSSHRSAFHPPLHDQRCQAYASPWGVVSSPTAPGEWDAMDVSSTQSELIGDYHIGPPEQHMDVTSSMVQEYPARPQADDRIHDAAHVVQDIQGNKPKQAGQAFGKKSSKWGLGGLFGHADKGHQHNLPPVDEVAASSTSTPSLKRTQSASTDSSNEPPMDPKKAKKEAERVQREAEKQRRALAEKTQREQARAVMQKRNQMQTSEGDELEWKWQTSASLLGTNGHQRSNPSNKTKPTTSGPIRGLGQAAATANADRAGSTTINAAAGRYGSQVDRDRATEWRSGERVAKARRREYDDDHSMSSSDVLSIGALSSISFATVDSDPGPSRLRTRPSLFGISRMTSTSSLRTSFDDFPTSPRSSNSFSLEHQPAKEFHSRASVDASSPLSATGSVSPPPMQCLSISPSMSPSPTWLQHNKESSLSSVGSQRQPHPTFISMPHPQHPSPLNPSSPHSPYEVGGMCLSIPPSPFGHPPSPMGPNSAINPMFKVPPLPAPSDDRQPSQHSLPPFSHLEAVAEGEYPDMSPISLYPPEAS